MRELIVDIYLVMAGVKVHADPLIYHYSRTRFRVTSLLLNGRERGIQSTCIYFFIWSQDTATLTVHATATHRLATAMLFAKQQGICKLRVIGEVFGSCDVTATLPS